MYLKNEQYVFKWRKVTPIKIKRKMNGKNLAICIVITPHQIIFHVI